MAKWKQLTDMTLNRCTHLGEQTVLNNTSKRSIRLTQRRRARGPHINRLDLKPAARRFVLGSLKLLR